MSGPERERRAEDSGFVPAAVLFDLDGTLIATRRLYLESFADALESRLGRRPTAEELIARRPRAEIPFLRELAGAKGHARVMERFYQAYEARHDRDFEGVYSGVPEMLQRMRGLDVPVGLVTGKSRRAWTITEARVGLGEWAVTVFDDDVPAPKPDPTGIRLALDALGHRPDWVLYLGDAPTDLEAARRAGVRPGAVLWSKREHERTPFRERALELEGVAFSRPDQVTDLFQASPAR